VEHGAGLAILTPAWIRFIGPFHPAPIARYAQQVWGCTARSSDALLDGVAEALSSFYRILGLPTRLREIGIERAQLPAIAELACPAAHTIGSLHPLDSSQVEEILRIAF